MFSTVRHGITRIEVEGAFKHQPHSMLLITVNNYQLPEVISCIRKADERAFMTLNAVEKIIGNYYQKPLE